MYSELGVTKEFRYSGAVSGASCSRYRTFGTFFNTTDTDTEPTVQSSSVAGVRDFGILVNVTNIVGSSGLRDLKTVKIPMPHFSVHNFDTNNFGRSN